MSPSNEEMTLTVERGGERLDRFLADVLADVTRGEIQRWIREGRVIVNGRVVKPSHKLAAGDILMLARPRVVRHEIAAEHIPLSIVYEDADLLVIDKPAGMVVHPAPGHMHGTLVNALLARDPALAEVGGRERAGIVHRLDRDTSGLIVVGKTVAAHHALQRQFKARRVQKTYLALVEGFVQTPEGRIEAPIARDPARRKRMAVVSAQRGGRAAATAFSVVGYYLAKTGAQRLEYSLLELDLLTGRTHQIRVHLAFIKHPVVGDRVYGRRRQRIRCPRQFLHAARLQFLQPTTGEAVEVETPLPADLQGVLDSLEALS